MKLPPATPTPEMLQSRAALCDKRVVRAKDKLFAAQAEYIAAIAAAQLVADEIAVVPFAQMEMASVWVVGG